MSSITGSGQFHDPAYLYGDGAGQYFDTIQVGGSIVLSDLGTEQQGILATSIGHENTYSQVYNVPNSTYNFNYSVGGQTRFRIENTGVKVYTGGSLQPVSYSELSYLQNSRSNIQSQIDAINPGGSNSYWGYAYSNASNQSLTSANTVKIALLTNYDASGLGTQLADPSGGGAPYESLQVLYAGIYQIVANFQVEHNAANRATFAAWFKKNGVNIATSLKQFHVSGAGAIDGFQIEMTMALAVNDKISVQWTSDDVGVRLYYTAPVSSPYSAPAGQAYTLAISQLSTSSPYYATEAEEAAAAALTYRNQAQGYATDASNSAIASAASAAEAKGYATDASNSSIASAKSAADSKTSATASANSATASASSATASANSAADSKTYSDGAIAAQTGAGVSAGLAYAAATSAGVSATAAAASATAAATAATAAGGSATTASTQATNAATSATNASNSSAQAKSSADEAKGAANDSKTYRDETKTYRDETKNYRDEVGGYVNRVETLENKTQYQTSVNAPFQQTTFASPVVAQKFEIQEAGIPIAGVKSTGEVFGETLAIRNPGGDTSQINGVIYLGGEEADSNVSKVVVNAEPFTTNFYDQVNISIDEATFYGNTTILPQQVNVGNFIRLYPASGQIHCSLLVAAAITYPTGSFFNNWI
jgi:hypothetical protein